VKQSASGLAPEPDFDDHPAFGAWGEPSQHDGCTVCGNSGHDTHQHVDPGVEGEINDLFTPADLKHLKAQPGLPTPYSAWQGDPNDDSPYNPGNYGPEHDSSNVYCPDCGQETRYDPDDAPIGSIIPCSHCRKDIEITSALKSLDRGYAMFSQALKDKSFAFHFTAAWKDVRAKARRIRAEGGVHLTESKAGFVVAQVKGDHGTYESVIMRVPGTQKVGQWDCGCKWAKYHWGAPDDFSRFAGRMCSHVMALNFEAQSRGMFGREISTDEGTPPWLTKGDMTKASSLDIIDAIDYAPVHVFAALAIQGGDDPIEVLGMLRLIAAVSSPFGEPGPSSVPGPTPGGTSMPDPNANPASAGFLTGADPRSWGQQTPGDLGDRTSAQHTAYDESMFDADLQTQAAIDPKEAWVQMLVPLVRAIAPKLIKTFGPSLVQHEIGKHRGEPDGGEGHAGEEPGGEGAPTDPMGAANNFANNLKSWTDKSKQEGDYARQKQNAYSSLHDQPEPALPSTDSAEDDPDIFTAADSHEASVLTGTEYSTPTDPGSSGGGGMAPGMGLAGDPTSLEPEDQSFVSTGTVADIVAQFQATAGAQAINAPTAAQAATNSVDGVSIAEAAKAHLQKAAMATFSPAEQQELIREGEGSTEKAANLDRLEITGTHYEALDALAAADDEDAETWTA
jgi:hypothetical protein